MIANFPTTPSKAAIGVLAVVLFAMGIIPASVSAQDSPDGRIIADIIPVNNRLRTKQQILGKMLSRAGKVYDANTARDDVGRLLATGWFAANGVELKTSVGNDGQVTVFVSVRELQSTVREVVFLGNDHYSDNELFDVTQIRRGGPMNPSLNRYAAQAITRKLQDDGRFYASVSLLEGENAGDGRVVFRIVEGPVVRIQSVDFRGNKSASSDRLRTIVNSRGALLGVTTILTPKYTPAMMDEDKQQLVQYYRRLGYLDMQVEAEVSPVGRDLSGVNIIYHIQEGKPYKVRNIRIDGNQVFPETRIRKIVTQKPGEFYDESLVQADVRRISTLYGNGGYKVGVEPGVFLAQGTDGQVDVHYRVMEPETRNQRGPDRVGNIEIKGNNVTRDSVILNQLRGGGLDPGQILEYPRVEQARQNLIRLNIFGTDPPPNIEVLPPRDPDSPFRDIRVTVQETRTGMVGLQVGVNSNAGVNGTFSVNQRNFDLFRFPTSFRDLMSGNAFRGGGQELRLTAMPGAIFQRYEVTWRDPFIRDSLYGLTSSFYFNGRGFAEYNENRYGGRFTVDRRLDNFGVWSANASARVEGVELFDVPEFASNAISRDVGNHFLLGLRAGINRDTRDSFLMPTTGSVIDLGIEQVVGDYNFPIGTFEATKFWTLHQARDGGWKGVLAARTQVSATAENAPVFERFYGGGFRSLRGFTFRGVGPFENQLNVGGSFAFVNTLEYQIPLVANERLRFVTFVDHGTIERDVAIRDYRVSVGLGLRLQVPAFGPLPIALDFAWPIRRGPGDNEQIFSFYVGWIGGQ